ncbi:pectate lyase-domain-containing protein, partial [Pseudomassariella vexata]
LQITFAEPAGTSDLPAVQTIVAGNSFYGGMFLFDRSPRTPLPLSTRSNVMLGATHREVVQCLGTCQLNDVWWTDVCEDAATFPQTSGPSTVNDGGAKDAEDKVFQHNGGGLLEVKNLYVENMGCMYQPGGTCGEMPARASTFDDIVVNGANMVTGMNGNFEDTTTVLNSYVVSESICELFEGS